MFGCIIDYSLKKFILQKKLVAPGCLDWQKPQNW